MKKNVTIRSDESNIIRWKKVADLQNQTLNTWIVNTLNIEASIMEEAFIVRHKETVFNCSYWEIYDIEGKYGGRVEARMESSFGLENGIFTVFDKDGNEVGSKKGPLGTMTKREVGNMVIRTLENGLPGVKILLDLNSDT